MKNTKKIFALILCLLLLISAGIIPSASADTGEGSQFMGIPASYRGSDGLYYSNIRPSEESFSSFSVLPSKYDSREAGLVTPVRDQGQTGTCWAHATLAACESSMLAQGQTSSFEDFSELHLSYTAYNTPFDALGFFDSYVDPEYVFITQNGGDWLNYGGFTNTALNALISWCGPVPENANHGQYSSSKFQMMNPLNFEIHNPEEFYTLNSMHVENAYNVYANNQTAVKELIMEYGAGSVHINANKLNYDTSTFFSYTFGCNHVVTIIGWDDSYPRENCEVDGLMPDNDGAWLIKNSWGDYEGIDGYYWLSYEDQSMLERPVQFIALNTEDNYDNNYQYDDVFADDTYVYFGNTEDLWDENGNMHPERIGIVGGGTMANIYTAQKEDEVLKAVGFFTANSNLNYEITIYKFDGDSMVAVSNTSGTEPFEGYHTRELDTPVSLAQGESFMVAVTLYSLENPDEAIRFTYDGISDLDMGMVKVSTQGESILYTEERGWLDLQDIGQGNFRIKAFTDSKYEGEIPTADYYDYYMDMSRDDLLTELTSLVDVVYFYTPSDVASYSKTSLEAFSEYYYYATSVVYNAPELYTAQELYYIIGKLNAKYDALEPFDIRDFAQDYFVDDYTISFVSTLVGYNDYLTAFNELIDSANEGEITADLLYDTYIPGFMELNRSITLEAIYAGYGDSNLQLRGDANGDAEINIKDSTLIQKILAESAELNIYAFFGGNCDRDMILTVRDATHIQKYVANVIEYLGFYDNSFAWGDEPMFDAPLTDTETAIENLTNALSWVSDYDVEFLLEGSDSDLVLACIIMDANEVLEAPENYHPQVIDFKARNLLWYYHTIYGTVG